MVIYNEYVNCFHVDNTLGQKLDALAPVQDTAHLTSSVVPSNCVVEYGIYRKPLIEPAHLNMYYFLRFKGSRTGRLGYGRRLGRLLMPALRVLVADDHEVVRKGLCALLQEQPGWVVAAQARDGREAVDMAKQVKPDIIVMDISMPGLNGLEATRQIGKSLPQAKVLILTMHESDSLIREVIEAGARGYLLKVDAGADLIKAVDALRRNQTFFTSKVSEMVLDGYLTKPGKHAEANSASLANRLTARQREILQLLAEGKSSKEVAVALGLSVKTAETHRANIMSRLHCHSVSELVRYAIRNQVIQP
jgi:DNA-binding NarL/FixJ family response regulator